MSEEHDPAEKTALDVGSGDTNAGGAATLAPPDSGPEREAFLRGLGRLEDEAEAMAGLLSAIEREPVAPCSCGEPEATDTTHRLDGPCYRVARTSDEEPIIGHGGTASGYAQAMDQRDGRELRRLEAEAEARSPRMTSLPLDDAPLLPEARIVSPAEMARLIEDQGDEPTRIEPARIEPEVWASAAILPGTIEELTATHGVGKTGARTLSMLATLDALDRGERGKDAKRAAAMKAKRKRKAQKASRRRNRR